MRGDIVSLTKWKDLVYKVVYDNCRYELHNDNEICCYVLSIYKSKDIIVMGNIHDNPELLREASKPIAQDVLASATDEGEDYIMGFTLMQG
ncbi:MAG: YopX family protein [Huintestinicola sp.]